MRLCINKKCSLCSTLFGNFSIAKCCSIVNCFLLFFITFYCLELILYELRILFTQNGHVAYRRHYHACHEGMAASDFLCYQIFQFLVHCFCKYLMPGSVHMLLVSGTAAYIGGGAHEFYVFFISNALVYFFQVPGYQHGIPGKFLVISFLPYFFSQIDGGK